MSLSFPAASAKLPRMKALCEARASADSPQNEGWAPIHIASRHGHAPWRTACPDVLKTVLSQNFVLKASLSMTAQLKWMDISQKIPVYYLMPTQLSNQKELKKIIPTHGVPFQNVFPLFLEILSLGPHRRVLIRFGHQLGCACGWWLDSREHRHLGRSTSRAGSAGWSVTSGGGRGAMAILDTLDGFGVTWLGWLPWEGEW